VKRRQIRLAVASRQRKMKVVDMEVHDVEFVHACEYALQHHDMARKRIAAIGIEPNRGAADRHVLRRRHRSAAREQRDVVPLAHELVRQIRDDAFGASIQLRRYALIKRGDLRDTHGARPPLQLSSANGRAPDIGCPVDTWLLLAPLGGAAICMPRPANGFWAVPSRSILGPSPWGGLLLMKFTRIMPAGARLRAAALLASLTALRAGATAGAQEDVPFWGNIPVAPEGIANKTLPNGPFEYATAEGQDIRVVVLTKELEFPYATAFVPDGTSLDTERLGRLRMLRDGKLVAKPVEGGPPSFHAGTSGLPGAIHGYMNIAP